MITSVVFFPLKTALTAHQYLFPYKFQDCFSHFSKEYYWNFSRDCIEPIDYFCTITIFKARIPQIQEITTSSTAFLGALFNILEFLLQRSL